MNNLTDTTAVWMWTESRQDHYGDEYPVHCVGLCDDDGPAGEVWGHVSQNKAWETAEELSKKTGFTIENDMAII